MKVEVESDANRQTVLVRIHFTPEELIKTLTHGTLELRGNYADIRTWTR
jgi:hypothetical protein